jgi:hypothetical protein
MISCILTSFSNKINCYIETGTIFFITDEINSLHLKITINQFIENYIIFILKF